MFLHNPAIKIWTILLIKWILIQIKNLFIWGHLFATGFTFLHRCHAKYSVVAVKNLQKNGQSSNNKEIRGNIIKIDFFMAEHSPNYKISVENTKRINNEKL